MGSCSSTPNPQDKLDKDPSIIACTVVRDTFIDYGRHQSSNIGNCQGLMYVTGERLHYKCHFCLTHCNRSFNLKDITSVEVVEDETFQVKGKSRIHLNPGLKIELLIQSQSVVEILVQMTDARGFAELLNSILLNKEPY